MRTMINDKYLDMVTGGWVLNDGTELTNEKIDFYASLFKWGKASDELVISAAETLGFPHIDPVDMPVDWEVYDEFAFIDAWAAYQKKLISTEQFVTREYYQ